MMIEKIKRPKSTKSKSYDRRVRLISSDANYSRQIERELLKAAEDENFKTMDELLKKGSNPALYGYRGTPIIYSLCGEGSLKSAVYLINNKPDCVNARTDHGHSLLIILISRGIFQRQSALVNQSEIDEVIELVLKKGIDVDYERMTPNGSLGSVLHTNMPLSSLEIILKYNPNPFILDCWGHTPAQCLKNQHAFNNDEKITLLKKIQMMQAYEKQYRLHNSKGYLCNLSRISILTAFMRANQESSIKKSILPIIPFVTTIADMTPQSTVDTKTILDVESSKFKISLEATAQTKEDAQDSSAKIKVGC